MLVHVSHLQIGRMPAMLALVVGLSACKGEPLPEASCGANHGAGWVELPELPEALESAGVAITGGRAYVAGGYDFEDGARDEVVSIDLNEAYEGTGEWRDEALLPLPTEHQAMVATSEGALVLMGGDQDYGSTVREQVWVAMPDEEGRILEWTEAAPLPEGRTLHAAAVRERQGGDDVYIVGGTWSFADGMVFADTVWHGRLSAEGVPLSWSEATTLPDSRGWTGVAVQGGKLVVSGGLYSWGPARSASEVWSADIAEDGSLGEWSELEPLPTGRHRHSLTEVGQVLHLAGGDSDEGVLDELLVLDGAGSWANAKSLPERRFSHGAAEADGNLLIFGGFREFRETRSTAWAIRGCGG